jgi:hypothetical protein
VLVRAEPLWSRSLVNLLKHSAKPAWGKWGMADSGIGRHEKGGSEAFSIGNPQTGALAQPVVRGMHRYLRNQVHLPQAPGPRAGRPCK